MELDFLKDISEESLRKLAFLFQAGKVEPEKAGVTIEDFKQEYISHMKEKGYSNAYITSSEFTLKKLFTYFGTAKAIKEIDIRSAEKFIYSLQKNAPRGVINYLRNLKVIFSQAVKWEYITENVFNKITLPKKQKTNPEFMGPTELELICSFITIQAIKDIILFSFYTGARLGEAINITWQDIDLTERNIHIGRNCFTKSRKERTVPICNPLYEILTRRKTETKIIELDAAYVFKQKDGDRYKPDFVSKSFCRARRKAKLGEGIHFHTCRHSFASNLVQKGVSIYTVKELLGHSSVVMTEIYSHLQTEDLRKAVNLLNR
ncbi:MAG: tyrosine-type recombinase/integrase [Ignavibacteriaceae bacterium]|nr:tyrosine-type recombinase/integrase [Ignavibacteriaceae bacterium]